MVSVLSHGLEPMVVLMLALLLTTVEPLWLPPLIMASMELMLMDMVPILTTVLELGVHNLNLMLALGMVLIMVNGPDMVTVLLLITLLSVTMVSDTLALKVTILLLSLWVITAMEPTALGELLLIQVPGPVIGLVLMPTVLLHITLDTRVYGILLLMLGPVLSTLLLLMVPMTGPQLVLLLSMLPPFPDGHEIMKQQIKL
jgi:hypothetical protein